jgi:hypothetical protein
VSLESACAPRCQITHAIVCGPSLAQLTTSISACDPLATVSVSLSPSLSPGPREDVGRGAAHGRSAETT